MNILKFDSVADLAATAALLWRDRLRSKPSLRMCVPSGNTPTPVYEAVVESASLYGASFANSHVFALDEYGGLPADHPARCANMIRRHLVDHIDLPPSNFHWLDTLAPDVEAVCRDYEVAIGDGFDLTVLGIGLNGHIGLNEPGSAPDSITRTVKMEASSIQASAGYGGHGDLPWWGATVGIKKLSESREVWLLATGQAKAPIVREILLSKPTSEVPATFLKDHPNCWLFIDSAAASNIRELMAS